MRSGWDGDVWDDGVKGQRKTRGETIRIGVGEKHDAHIVVRESVKLLTLVLMPWVRCGSHTMRNEVWVLKDGRNDWL